MTKLISSLFVLLALAIPAHAQDQVRFVGNWHIVSKTNNGACNLYDPVGERATARFRLVIAGTSNGTQANLSIAYSDGARNFRANGNFTTAFKTTVGTNIFDSAGTVTPAQLVRFVTQVPATITSSTRFINITGEVNNYDFMPNCRIQFGLTVQRRFE